MIFDLIGIVCIIWLIARVSGNISRKRSRQYPVDRPQMCRYICNSCGVQWVVPIAGEIPQELECPKCGPLFRELEEQLQWG